MVKIYIINTLLYICKSIGNFVNIVLEQQTTFPQDWVYVILLLFPENTFIVLASAVHILKLERYRED